MSDITVSLCILKYSMARLGIQFGSHGRDHLGGDAHIFLEFWTIIFFQSATSIRSTVTYSLMLMSASKLSPKESKRPQPALNLTGPSRFRLVPSISWENLKLTLESE
jgi:hypothetical protein